MTEPKWSFAQKFYADFNATASELASRLDALGSSTDIPPALLQAVISDVSRLAKSLSDATGSLPSYDQRQYELQLKGLEKSVEQLRGAAVHAPKFSFKRKAAKSKPPIEQPLPPKPQPMLVETARTMSGFSHRYLTMLDVRSHTSVAEVSVSGLDNCIVNLLPCDEDHTKITALHVQRVSRSVLLLPRISGSIILYDLSDCVVVVGCHQFRMHSSTTVDVYLESGSDPVIEHCSGIRFATYPNSLVCGSTLQNNRHFTVRDFSHILSTSSPNWSALLEAHWERSWPVRTLQDQLLHDELERMLPVHASSDL